MKKLALLLLLLLAACTPSVEGPEGAALAVFDAGMGERVKLFRYEDANAVCYVVVGYRRGGVSCVAR